MSSAKPGVMLPAFRDRVTGRVYMTGFIHDLGMLPKELRKEAYGDGSFNGSGRFTPGFVEGGKGGQFMSRRAAEQNYGAGETYALRDLSNVKDYDAKFQQAVADSRITGIEGTIHGHVLKMSGVKPKRSSGGRKSSSSGGGEVSVSGYTTGSGKEVSSYTRSRP